MNLRQYPDPCISGYLTTVHRKQDEALKARLQALEQAIRLSYSEYEEAQLANDLQRLVGNPNYNGHAEDLLSLYEYKSKAIRDIKKRINSSQIHKITITCQNCTINSVNSFDHILGKTAFPEFAVNPYNLFPSCTECNGHKSSQFMEGQHRRFLNLYLDALPIQQYLFVDFKAGNRELEYEFIVENRNNIHPEIFAIIANHYRFLELPRRMKEKASESYISELETTMKSHLEDLTLERTKAKVIKNANLNMLAFGHNHFKYILEIALVQNADFLRRL